MFSEWHWTLGRNTTARISTSLPVMSGEGNGLGALGLLAGYLGKVQERAASLDSCPWCAANGQIRALRSYRINLHKSITLCTDPQCLFPLVSRPLEDVLASLAPSEPQFPIGGKRKSPSGSENTSPKRARSVGSDVMFDPGEMDCGISATELCVGHEGCNGKMHSQTVKEETICQSEPTNVVDNSLPLPVIGRVGAGRCHKDSDWQKPEKIRDEDGEGEDVVFLPGEGTPVPGMNGPVPAYQVAASSEAEMETESTSEEVQVNSPSEEAVCVPEKTSAAPQCGVSIPGDAWSPAAWVEVTPAPQMSAPVVEGSRSASLVVPDLEDTVCLLEALTAPAAPVQVKEGRSSQRNVSAPNEAVSPTVEAKLPRAVVPVGGLAPPSSVSALQEAVAMLQEVLPVAAVERNQEEPTTPAMGPASVFPEAPAVSQETSVVKQDVLSVCQKAKGEAAPSNVLEEDEEVAPLVTVEVASPSEEAGEVLPALVEAASEKDEEEGDDEADGHAPSILMNNDYEKELPGFDEEEGNEGDRPPGVVCKPCIVDLSHSKVSEDHVHDEDAEEDLPIFDKEECPPGVVCKPCLVDLSQSKVSGDEDVVDDDDGPVQAKRGQNGQWLVSSEDEVTDIPEYREGGVTAQELGISSRPRENIVRPRKTHFIKYMPTVIPDFDPEVMLKGTFVPVPGPHLFWKNENSLCWLDSLLVALVHCCSLRDRRPTKRPGEGHPVWDLCERYDRVCGLLTAHQRAGPGNMMQTPSMVLQRVQMEMQAIRVSIFNLLEPQLKSNQGRKETPVFALRFLLRADSWAEPLFRHMFEWQFDCVSATCRYATNTKCKKTLTRFCKVIYDWHPLNATYLTRCSKCNKSKQNRTLVLESVAPVLVLHFAEGLPKNDVSIYSFTFQQQKYSVSTVIQYNKKRNHFVTWIRTTDGSWLEFDDLKHPSCVSHTQLVVPPREIHVVFWELDTDRLDQVPHTISSHPPENTSPSLAQNELMHPNLVKLFVNNSLVPSQKVSDADTDMDTTIRAGNGVDTLLKYDKGLSTAPTPDLPVLSQTPNPSLASLHDDTAVAEVLTVSDNSDDDMYTTVTAGNIGDTSVGSDTLLNTLEGFSHSDTVTLTLVEIQVDSGGKPLDDNNVIPAAEQNGHFGTLHSASDPEAEVPSPAPEITITTHEIPQTGSEITHETSSPACKVMPQSDKLPETDDEDLVSEIPSSPDTASEFLPDSSSSSEPDWGQPSPPRRRKSTKAISRPRITSRAPVASEAKVAASKMSPAAVTPVALAEDGASIILPTVVSTMSPACVEPDATTPATCSTTSPQNKPILPPPLDPNSRWSYLLTRHPSQAPLTSPPSETQGSPAPFNQVDRLKPNQFQQLSQSRQPTLNPGASLAKSLPRPKPKLCKEDNEALPLKAAEMYGGFQVRSRNVNANTNLNNISSRTFPPSQLTTDHRSDVWMTPSQPCAAAQRKLPVNNANTAAVISLPPSPGFTVLPNIPSSRKRTPGGQALKSASLTETDALRYKLLKKLKAKKKKLEKLNQVLGYQEGGAGAVTSRPDSTDLCSPVTVSSSTSVYDSPAYNEFFADLLSPAPTVHNVSPDSTGFLDMLATNGQDGGSACVRNSVGASQVVTSLTLQPASHTAGVPQLGMDGPIVTSGETFLDEFMSGSASQQTEMDNEALSALDLFF